MTAQLPQKAGFRVCVLVKHKIVCWEELSADLMVGFGYNIFLSLQISFDKMSFFCLHSFASYVRLFNSGPHRSPALL
jgi:hypothetical protein